MRTLALAAVLLAAPFLEAADLPAAPSGVVADAARLFNEADKAKLEALGAQVLREQGVGLRVLTIPDATGENPKAIAVRALNQWRVGQRSVLLLVVMNPRSLFLQPGTALAGIFDASTSSGICALIVAPQMRNKAFGAGALAGLGAVRDRLAHPAAARAMAPSRPQGSAIRPARSSTSEGDDWATAVKVLHLDLLGGLAVSGFSLFWIISKVFAKKCPDCGVRMSRLSQVIEAPTFQATGVGEHIYTCGSCSHVESASYQISKRWWGNDSSDTGESGTRDSWDSSSSSSSSSSDGGSSSDGSGGGGSSF